MWAMTSRLARALALLTPSVTSGFMALGFSIVVLAWQGWAYVSHKQLFYDFLFGSLGVKTNLLTTSNILSNFRNSVLSNRTLYELLLVTCAVGVGLLVYALVSGASRLARDSSALANEMTSQDARLRATFRDNIKRIVAHIAAAIVWLIYIAVFLNGLYPVSIVALHHGLDKISAGGAVGWAWLALSALSLTVFTHLNATFLRLTLLRYRVFGTYEEG